MHGSALVQHPGRSLQAWALGPSMTGNIAMPDGFQPLDHSMRPKLLIPLVFHVLSYRAGYDSSVIGPPQYIASARMVQRLVAVTNLMAAQAGVGFALLAVRNDPNQHPYLLLESRAMWLNCLILPAARGGSMPSPACPIYASTAYTRSNVVSFPRAINVFVSGDSSSNGGVVGYAYRPGNPKYPAYGHVAVSWDTVWTGFLNSADMFEEGAGVLWHELAHHLGLQHPFGSRTIGCGYDDLLSDTPRTAGPVYSQPWAWQAQEYCYDLFYNKFGGGAGAWQSIYARWGAPAGVPAEDSAQSWGDSCTNQPGYDELGNYLTYSLGVCVATLGHLTSQQVGWLHRVSYEEQYELYAWAQYYAKLGFVPGAVALPDQAPALGAAMSFDPCKVSASGCPCKTTWTFNGRQQRYCSALLDPTSTATGLWCMLDLDALMLLPDSSHCAPRYIVAASSGMAGAAWDTCAASATLCARVSPDLASQAAAIQAARQAEVYKVAVVAKAGLAMPSTPPTASPPPPLYFREECMVSANGCRCKPLWRYDGRPSSFCASPDGDARLWCLIENDDNCKPTAEPNDWSWDYCAPSLTPDTCMGSPSGGVDVPQASCMRMLVMALLGAVALILVLQ